MPYVDRPSLFGACGVFYTKGVVVFASYYSPVFVYD